MGAHVSSDITMMLMFSEISTRAAVVMSPQKWFPGVLIAFLVLTTISLTFPFESFHVFSGMNCWSLLVPVRDRSDGRSIFALSDCGICPDMSISTSGTLLSTTADAADSRMDMKFPGLPMAKATEQKKQSPPPPDSM